MPTATATRTEPAERLEQLRAQVATIDARIDEIDARLAELPPEDERLRLASVRGDLTPRKASAALEDLAAEEQVLRAERAELSRNRNAITQVLGELEAEQAEARAVAALEAGAAVQARIGEAWQAAGGLLARLASAWTEIMQAERELAALRDQVPDHDRKGKLASPSEPLPANFWSLLHRLHDACVVGDKFATGQLAELLPDLSDHRRHGSEPAIWLQGVARFERAA